MMYNVFGGTLSLTQSINLYLQSSRHSLQLEFGSGSGHIYMMHFWLKICNIDDHSCLMVFS